MVDFANGNLCGASPELNSVLSKLDDAKAEITAKIDEAASVAAAAFGESKNELEGLVGKLQTIEIPTLPKLNLQAEITSLLSQIPASSSYISALEKIKTEFDDDIKAAGLKLETLVTDATAAISGGGNICAAIPNLEKEAGSTEASVEKPAAVKQAAKKAITEVVSKVNQNTDISAKLASIGAKTLSFITTAVPPTKDTGSFKLAPPSIIKSINVSGSSVNAAVAPSKVSERTNYVPKDTGDGFSYKKAKKYRAFRTEDITNSKGILFEEVEDQGDGYYAVTFKHKPTRIKIIAIHPGENFTRVLIPEYQRKLLGFEEPSTIANKQFYYKNYWGRHMAILYYYSSSANRVLSPKTNIAIFGNTLRFYSPIKLTTHPGNIDSGGYAGQTTNPTDFARTGTEPFLDGQGPGLRIPGKHGEDHKYNKKFKGSAVEIIYEYMEKYDPDYQTGTTPTKVET